VCPRRVSGMGYRVSGARYPAPGIRRQVSGARKFVGDRVSGFRFRRGANANERNVQFQVRDLMLPHYPTPGAGYRTPANQSGGIFTPNNIVARFATLPRLAAANIHDC
jgi:hypothetical protein